MGKDKQKSVDLKVSLFGVKVSGGSRAQVLRAGRELITDKHGKRCAVVVTPNPEQVVEAQSNTGFMGVLNKAEVAIADGVGLVWAVKMLSKFNPNYNRMKLSKISGVEYAKYLVQETVKQDRSVLIVGGKDKVAETAAFRLVQELGVNPRLIQGMVGYRQVDKPKTEEEKVILEKVEEMKPALVLVAFGAPKQELWIEKQREALGRAGVGVAMAVGGAVDYWAGEVRRAPMLVQELGFEWLWRLFQEPWRWRRQLRLVKFVGMVAREVVRG